MKALYKDGIYLHTAVPHVDTFIQTYSTVVDKLTELEKQYTSTNPHFNMSDMWTYNSIKGTIQFNTTRQCVDTTLRVALKNIFDGVAL